MNELTLQTTTVLNRLLQTLHRSLPIYLADARPWVGHEDGGLWSALTNVAIDYRDYVARLADMILELGGPLEVGLFPMEFSSLHDLSIDYLLQKSIEFQRRDVEIIRGCMESLEPDSPSRLLAEEVLGNASGHLERMLCPPK